MRFSMSLRFLIRQPFNRVYMYFKLFKQTESMDCGVFCLKMILYHYGQNIDVNWLRYHTNTNREGVSFFGMNYALRKLGYKSTTLCLPLEELKNITLPSILHWDKRHFVVLYNIKKKVMTTYTISLILVEVN